MSLIPLRRNSVATVDLEADARQFIEDAEHALAPRTREAYAYQWQRFVDWCNANGLVALPTDPPTVAAYFGHLARRGCAASTFAVVRAAIRYRHDRLPPGDAGRDVDLATPEIKRFLQGNKRRLHAEGRTTNKAAPFGVEHWVALHETIAGGQSLWEIRDLALLGLGVVRALRGPSELVALDYVRRSTGRGEIHVRAEGAVIRMHTTKTQQEGGDSDRVIAEGPALAALRRWINAAGIQPGTPLFRPLKRVPDVDLPVIGTTRLAGRSLHDIVRKRARQVLTAMDPGMSDEELDVRAAEYSTHSLRHGALTSMAEAGASMAELMELSRHSPHSTAIVMGYVKQDQAGARAMRKMGL